MSPLNMADAAVAIRSFPRRYLEVVSGPVGDDAWERLVRTVGPDGRSAIGFVAHVTELLTVLGTAIAALPVQTQPSVNVASLESKYSEPASSVTISMATDALRSAADRAATAVEGRSHNEFERSCSVDGHNVNAREFVERIVKASVAHLKDSEAAVDAAR